MHALLVLAGRHLPRRQHPLRPRTRLGNESRPRPPTGDLTQRSGSGETKGVCPYTVNLRRYSLPWRHFDDELHEIRFGFSRRYQSLEVLQLVPAQAAVRAVREKVDFIFRVEYLNFNETLEVGGLVVIEGRGQVNSCGEKVCSLSNRAPGRFLPRKSCST